MQSARGSVAETELPAGWVRQFSRQDGRPYYVNETTGHSQFEFPEPQEQRRVKRKPPRSRLSACCSRPARLGSLESQVHTLQTELQLVKCQLDKRRQAAIDAALRRADSKGSGKALRAKSKYFRAWRHVASRKRQCLYHALGWFRRYRQTAAFSAWHAVCRQAKKIAREHLLAELRREVKLANSKVESQHYDSSHDEFLQSYPAANRASFVSSWDSSRSPQKVLAHMRSIPSWQTSLD